jgi:MFS superfamily sulfate permease-like transporter
MSIVHDVFAFLFSATPVTWRADWAWGLPLVVLTAVIHVMGLGLIRHRGIPIFSNLTEGRHHTVVFGVIVGATTLLVTCLHGIEAGVWAAAYRFLGALPDGHQSDMPSGRYRVVFL